MIVKPMIRSMICINAHPAGCEAMVGDWVERAIEARSSVAQAAKASGKPLPKAVLVLGCSTGYGLASRVTAAFSAGAKTIGVSLEREPSDKKPGSPGWYDNRAFDRQAAANGLYSATFNMDAFSDEARAEVIRRARLDGLEFDQVIYSLASPVRTDPKTGVMHKSSLKPLSKPFSGISVDAFTGEIKTVSIEPATEDDAAETVKVMGGEDWELWIRALADAGVLARGCVTLAYSYIGSEHSWPIYRYGTIGRAKEHLERTAPALNSILKDLGGKAYVSVNKALVTRASAVIPVIPLYVAALFKTMKGMGLHEDCLDQIFRLYRERLLASGLPAVDEEGRIRLDDWEMRFDVQEETTRRMREAQEGKLEEATDMEGFRRDFLQAHGFDLPGVDYDADVSYL
jgi:enoyl-[acyl-carrier protein] reductase / trans-2-enoyl-CoA reductase (NAD+)